AARLLALRKPDGASKALLDYIPFAEQEYLAAEIRTALAALAVRDGKPDPVVVEALADRQAARRAPAGRGVTRAGADRKRPALHKLLQAPAPRVRLLVGLALTLAREKQAVPVLIALLDELPAEQLGEVEDVLCTLAGDKAPESSGTSAEERKKYRAAWDAWYR